MIPTESTVGGAHPAGDLGKDVAALGDAQCNPFQYSDMCFLLFKIFSGRILCMHHPSMQFCRDSDVCHLLQPGLLYSPMVAHTMTVPSHMPQILGCSCQAFLLTWPISAQGVTTRC